MSDGDFFLIRFERAQGHRRHGQDQPIWKEALEEVSDGLKMTHWMWYIFPTLRGVGQSPKAEEFAISGLDEAAAYLAHPDLGPRLIQISKAAAFHDDKSAEAIFGGTDAYKLHNCATLFHYVAPDNTVFADLLRVFYGGETAPRTNELLGR